MDHAAVEVLHYQDKELSFALLLQLNSLRQDRVLTDVLLCADKAEIPCHRNVLVSSSPYFRAMFCNNFLEANQTRIRIVGITPSILSSIIDYVYTGQISITMENVLPLMQAASMLQYGRLFEVCSGFLQDRLNPENCLSMIRLSEILSCNSLRNKAKAMAMESFSDVSSSEDLRELSLPELLAYLEDDALCADEEQVFETLVAWIHHDPRSRRGAVGDLFKKVRLRFVHPTYLFQFVANDPLIQSSALCTEIVESARRLALFSVNAASASGAALRLERPWASSPRRYACSEALVVVGGRKNNEQTSREALLFEERSQTWRCLAKLPLRLFKASYVCLHSVLYVLGGLTTAAAANAAANASNANAAHQVSSAVYTLSLKTNQWRAAVPMLAPHFAHESVSFLHFIFVLGGLGADRRVSDSVERYNSMFNQWESMSPLPEPVLHPAVAAADQRIYVFGGEDAMQNPVRIIQVYHVSRNLWSKMENRTVKNVSAPAAVLGDKVYIIGGYTRRVMAYDTKANRFIKCANLKERRMHHAAAVLRNKLYITGGRHINGQDAIEDSDAIECYDPQTDRWTYEGRLPHKLFDHGALSLTSVAQTEQVQAA